MEGTQTMFAVTASLIGRDNALIVSNRISGCMLLFRGSSNSLTCQHRFRNINNILELRISQMSPRPRVQLGIIRIVKWILFWCNNVELPLVLNSLSGR